MKHPLRFPVTPLRPRTARALTGRCATALCLLSLAGCDLGPVDLEEIAKLVPAADGSGDVLIAARTPGDEAGDPDNNFLRYHAALSNPTNEMLVVDVAAHGVRIDGQDHTWEYVLNPEQAEVGTPYYDSQPDDKHLYPGETDVYKFEFTALGGGLEGAGFLLDYEGTDDRTRLMWPVETYENATSVGGYNFPARVEDLHPGEFWSQGKHKHARHQAYALDLGVKRWRDGDLTSYTLEAFDDAASGVELGSRNEHFGVWGKPVYAMRSGTIVKCRRLRPDHPPGKEHSVSGANVVSVDHGNGEFASYVHLMDRSTPAHLCPMEVYGNDFLDPPVQIEKGDFLGRVGNSGPSQGPHLHLAVSDSDHTNPLQRSVPINFGNIDVHGSNGFQLGDDLNEVDFSPPKAMGPGQILKPNAAGWPAADLALGHQFTERDGSYCKTRENGQDLKRVDLEADQYFDARNLCNISAEVEIYTYPNWTMDIDANERSGMGRTLLLSSYNGDETRKRNLALEWVKLRYGSSYVYVVSLRRIDSDTVQTWTLQGSGHLFIDINKNSMSFNYGTEGGSSSIGFVGVGATKRGSLHSWEAASNLL